MTSTVTLTVPGVVTVAPGSVIIQETAGQHDLVTITMDTPTDLRSAVGEPCWVEIMDGPYVKRIVGYLDTYVPGTNATKYHDTYYILGASSTMRSGASRVWRDAAPYDIAKEIVGSYSFGLEFDKYAFRLPVFHQSAESDWETLVRLAGECGYMLYAHNTTIRMVHPTQEIRRRMRAVLPFYTVPTAGGAATNVGEFATVNTKSPIGFENTMFTGVDKYGKSFSVLADTGSTVTKKASTLSQSLSEAQAAADRLKARNFLLDRATMSVTGAVRLEAGGCVSVKDGGEQHVWLITDIRHNWSAQDTLTPTYTAAMNLCRAERADIAPSPYRDVSNRPGNFLAAGKWRAERNWMVEL